MSLTMSNSTYANNNNNTIINNTMNVNATFRFSRCESSRKPITMGRPSILRKPKYTSLATMASLAAQDASNATRAREHKVSKTLMALSHHRVLCSERDYGTICHALERVQYQTPMKAILEDLYEVICPSADNQRSTQEIVRIVTNRLQFELENTIQPLFRAQKPDARTVRFEAVQAHNLRERQSTATRSMPQRLGWQDERNATKIYYVQPSNLKYHAPKIHQPIPEDQMVVGCHTAAARVTVRTRTPKRKAVAGDATTRPIKRRRTDDYEFPRPTAPQHEEEDVFGLFAEPTPTTFCVEPPAVAEEEERPEETTIEVPPKKRVRFCEEQNQVIEFEMTPAECHHVQRRLSAYDRHEELVMKLRAKEVYVHRKRSPMGYCLTRAEEIEIDQLERPVQEDVPAPAVAVAPAEEAVEVAPAEEEDAAPPFDDDIAPVEGEEVAQVQVALVEEEVAQVQVAPVEEEEVAPPLDDEIAAVEDEEEVAQVPVAPVEQVAPVRRSPRLAALVVRQPRRSQRLATKKRVSYKDMC